MEGRSYGNEITIAVAIALVLLVLVTGLIRHRRGDKTALVTLAQGAAVLVIIAVIVMAMRPASRDKSIVPKRVALVGKVKLIAKALSNYALGNDGHLPPDFAPARFADALLPYVKKASPYSPVTAEWIAQIHANPALAGRKLERLKREPDLPLLYDPDPFLDGTYAVAFTNGKTRMVAKEEWQRLKQKLTPAGAPSLP